MVNHLYYEGKWTPQDDRGTPQDVAERGAASGRGTDSVWIVRHRRDGRLMTGLMAQDLGPNGAPCWLMMIGSSTTLYIYIYVYIYILYWRWDYHNNGNSRFRRSFFYSTFLRGIWEFPGFWDVFGFRGHSTCLTPCRWIRYPLCISWRFPLQAAPVPILISQECTQADKVMVFVTIVTMFFFPHHGHVMLRIPSHALHLPVAMGSSGLMSSAIPSPSEMPVLMRQGYRGAMPEETWRNSMVFPWTWYGIESIWDYDREIWDWTWYWMEFDIELSTRCGL